MPNEPVRGVGDGEKAPFCTQSRSQPDLPTQRAHDPAFTSLPAATARYNKGDSDRLEDRSGAGSSIVGRIPAFPLWEERAGV
ncbi:MAG: hypothetical protein L0Y44_14365, partial [Phycisphaerales bacterium]|nr:hypothetical protein [Phycisphaerales bacterium]